MEQVCLFSLDLVSSVICLVPVKFLSFFFFCFAKVIILVYELNDPNEDSFAVLE